jgi:hypothetical protein
MVLGIDNTSDVLTEHSFNLFTYFVHKLCNQKQLPNIFGLMWLVSVAQYLRLSLITSR